MLCLNSGLYRRLTFPYHFKRNGMLLTARCFCIFEINVWPLSPKNFTILTLKFIPVKKQCKLCYGGYLSILGCDSRLYRRLIFPYRFKRNGMLLTAKSFCFCEINVWPLSPSNFTILTQKLIPVRKQCKLRYRG